MTTSNKMKVKQISGEASTIYRKFYDLLDRLQEIATAEEDSLESVPYISRFSDKYEDDEEFVVRLNEAVEAVDEAVHKMLQAVEFIEQILE